MYDPNTFVGCDGFYDPKFDRQAVDQTGVLDVREAFVNGAIDGSVSVSAEHFNGVQDPSVLLPRPKDQFEALRQAEYVRTSLRAAKADAEAGQSSSDQPK